MTILETFYKEFIKEAGTGRIDAGMFYNIIFNTKISKDGNYIDLVKEENSYNNVLTPTLKIKNIDEFNELLCNYVMLAKKFYDEKDFEDVDNIDKSIMARLFANATIEDFDNANEFLKRRITFLEDDRLLKLDDLELGYLRILKSNISVTVTKEPIHEETPYGLQFTLTDPVTSDKYYMPRIRIGLDNDKAYIYALQNKIKNKDTSYSKKLSRLFKKVGKGIDVNEDTYENYGIGNLKDVTDSFLITLDITLGILDKMQIKKIEAPSILIERWNSKEIFYGLFVNALMKKGLSEEQARSTNIRQVEEHNNIQKNISDKFIRTFNRLLRHTNKVSLSSLPMDVTSSIGMDINESSNYFNNPLLEELYTISNSVSVNSIYK